MWDKVALLFALLATISRMNAQIYPGHNNNYYTTNRGYSPQSPGQQTANYQGVPNQYTGSGYNYRPYENNRPGQVSYDPRFPPPASSQRFYPGIGGRGASRTTCNILGTESLPQTLTITTRQGPMTGRIEYLCDGPAVPYNLRPGGMSGRPPNIYANVSAFLGIPYARPPVYDLRFRPPERAVNWQQLDATLFGPSCPQPPGLLNANGDPLMMNEDCLYLNVFTPSLSQSMRDLNPVMVYIHGGEFERGSAVTFPGHMLAAANKVVVVTINYRLGPLGFFSTADRWSPGNYGMLDQVLALKWVRENIVYFGGDSQKITLFGPDAGAASAGLHMFAPKSSDLFHGVIASGGAAVADWAAITDLERARNTSRVFAQRVGCDSSDTHRLVDCLRTRTAQELCELDFKADVGPFPWAPVVDRDIFEIAEENRFLPDAPENTLRRGNFNKNIFYVTGVTRDEGAYLVLKDPTLAFTNYNVNQQYLNAKIYQYIKLYNYTQNPRGAYEAITYKYTNWADPTNQTLMRDEYVDMMSDAVYKAPVDKMMKLMVEQTVKTYYYVFNSTMEGLRRPEWQAIPHNMEFFFITGAPFMDAKFYPPDPLGIPAYTAEDREMSKLMMTMWANLARFRDPTYQEVSYIKWEQAQPRNLLYLHLNTTRYSSMLRDYQQDENAFWTQYMPTLIGPPPPTFPPFMDPWYRYEHPLQVGFWGAISVAILLLMLLITVCCMYCRSSGRPKSRDIDFDGGSLPPDDYSLTAPIESENVKDEKTKYDTQHTSV